MLAFNPKSRAAPWPMPMKTGIGAFTPFYRSSALLFLKKFQSIRWLMNRAADPNLIAGISN